MLQATSSVPPRAVTANICSRVLRSHVRPASLAVAATAPSELTSIAMTGPLDPAGPRRVNDCPWPPTSRTVIEPSRLPVTTRVPSGVKATPPKCLCSAGRLAHSASPLSVTSQTLTTVIPWSPVMSRSPSGENATHSPPPRSCALIDRISRASSAPTAHTLAVPSLDPLASRRASALQSSETMSLVCPVRVKRTRPVRASRIRTRRSWPAVAIQRPSGLQSISSGPSLPSTSRTRRPERASTTTPAPSKVAIARRRPSGLNEVVSDADTGATSTTRRPFRRSNTRTARSACQVAARREPSGLKDAPHTGPSAPVKLCSRRPVRGSQTLTVPSSPVVASIDPSALKATRFTSPSCPRNARTRRPVRASRMSIRPLSSGPSVTNRLPSELQSTLPPRPGTRITIREATTARCSASARLGQNGAVGGTRVLHGFERQQHAALGVVVQGRDGGGGESARDGDATLALGARTLVEREQHQGPGHRDGRGQHRHQRPEPPQRLALHVTLARLARARSPPPRRRRGTCARRV